MRGTKLLLAWLVMFSGAAASGESLPHTVTVTAAKARLFAGPGESFYATSHVERDAELEVYKRKAGGWLAIRPPQDNFSWVAARNLRETDDPEVARVVGANVVAWIGTELRTIENHKWQVKLDPGEPVTVLGSSQHAIVSGDVEREYYRIAPPAGEFRWIHERNVQPLVQKISTTATKSEVQLADFRIVEEASTSDTTRRDGFVPRLGPGTTGDDERVASLAPRPDDRVQAIAPEDVDRLMAQLNVELSLMAAKPTQKWALAGLRRRAEDLIEQSSTTLSRGKATRLLSEIKEFETLQVGYASLSELATDRVVDAAVDRESVSRDSETSALDPRFDGKGWLLPVHSTRRAAPPYALLDSAGTIVAYVSPAPGLNLHRYLRKQVGIFGQRSRATFLEKSHLTADRIVDLQRHRR